MHGIAISLSGLTLRFDHVVKEKIALATFNWRHVITVNVGEVSLGFLGLCRAVPDGP